MRHNWYLFLAQTLKDKVPQLQHIDLYTDQLENEKTGKEDGFNYPAAFIRFNPTSIRTLKEGRQDGTLVFYIVLASRNINRTAMRTPEHIQAKALEHFALENEIYKALHNVRPKTAGMGTITRTSLDALDSINGLTISAQIFNCRVAFTSADVQYIAKDNVSLKVEPI